VRNTRILLISRKFPPSVGGMEIYTKNFVDSLKKSYSVDTILLSKNQLHLFWFFPFALIKSFLLNIFNRYDVIYIADALLSPLGLVLKVCFKPRIFVTVHGLDITFKNWLYQMVVPRCVSRFDKVICVSLNTLAECLKRGVPEKICTFIPNGVNIFEFYSLLSRREIESEIKNKIGIDLSGKKVILTTGRLIKRKGVDWFINNVFKNLPKEYIYLVLGDGPLKLNIQRLIKELNLEERVFVLGRVNQDVLIMLYNYAYVFVMPNQRIKDDPEGFGIVAIEAASSGLPVVANDVDGVNQAVLNGKTGWLVEYNNIKLFLDKIINIGLKREDVRSQAKIFSWDLVIEKYKSLINSN